MSAATTLLTSPAVLLGLDPHTSCRTGPDLGLGPAVVRRVPALRLLLPASGGARFPPRSLPIVSLRRCVQARHACSAPSSPCRPPPTRSGDSPVSHGQYTALVMAAETLPVSVQHFLHDRRRQHRLDARRRVLLQPCTPAGDRPFVPRHPLLCASDRSAALAGGTAARTDRPQPRRSGSFSSRRAGVGAHLASQRPIGGTVAASPGPPVGIVGSAPPCVLAAALRCRPSLLVLDGLSARVRRSYFGQPAFPSRAVSSPSSCSPARRCIDRRCFRRRSSCAGTLGIALIAFGALRRRIHGAPAVRARLERPLASVLVPLDRAARRLRRCRRSAPASSRGPSDAVSSGTNVARRRHRLRGIAARCRGRPTVWSRCCFQLLRHPVGRSP